LATISALAVPVAANRAAARKEAKERVRDAGIENVMRCLTVV
jgi:hypothetical protein